MATAVHRRREYLSARLVRHESPTFVTRHEAEAQNALARRLGTEGAPVATAVRRHRQYAPARNNPVGGRCGIERQCLRNAFLEPPSRQAQLLAPGAPGSAAIPARIDDEPATVASRQQDHRQHTPPPKECW